MSTHSNFPILFPQPQELRPIDGTIPLPRQIVLPADAPPLVQHAAERLAAAIGAHGGQAPAVVTEPVTESADGPAFYLNVEASLFDDTDENGGEHRGERAGADEAYSIHDAAASVYLTAADALGLSHAVETARQLIAGAEPGTWPRCRIDDWPDYAHRGIYAECFWGTDLMGLDDWRTFIDSLVSLKFNTLNVGLYGCWEIKYNGEPTEFLMVDLPDYPELRTPQTVRYVDPDSLAWAEARYLPRPVERDLWPQIFAYARERGLRIVPQFGGPAHNTLIPRLLPRVSARRADGSPTHYGYCTANPETWAFLRDVVGEIATRYCHPFDVALFNIAGDEVYPIRNVLPADPAAEVSPWCACEACRGKSEFEQLCAYLFGMTELLAEQGLRAVIWADSLDRMGKVAEFKEAAAARGLSEQIVLQWWCYKEPLPQLSSAPEIETWVEPSPGLVGNLLYQDFSRNIYGFLQRGLEAGATGVTAYNVPDRRLDKNYRCLADFSWNARGGSIPHFHIRYAQYTYGSQWRTALEAYDVAERIMGSYPLAVNVVDQLLHYFNNFPHGRVEYPHDVLAALAADPLALVGGLRLVAAHMKTAEELLAGLETGGTTRTDFMLECQRYRVLVEAVLAVPDALQSFAAAEAEAEAEPDAVLALLGEAHDHVAGAHAALRDLMRAMQATLAEYLCPSALRETSALLDWLGHLRQQLEQARHTYATNPAHGLPAVPALERFDTDRLRAAWHPWEF